MLSAATWVSARIDKKHSRFLVEVTFVGFPCGNILTDNYFVLAGEVAGDAEHSGGVKVLTEVL